MQQLSLDFESKSPINVEKLSKQNRQIFQHLASGQTITLLEAEQLYGIRHLHSRISDLRNIHQIVIYDKQISVVDRNGHMVHCKRYSLIEFTQM